VQQHLRLHRTAVLHPSAQEPPRRGCTDSSAFISRGERWARRWWHPGLA